MISSICFMWLSDKAFLYTMEISRKVTVYASSSFHISFQREDLHLENNFPSSKTKIFWGNMLGGPKKRELEKSTESCWLIINYKSQVVAQKLYFFYMTFGKQALSLTPASLDWLGLLGFIWTHSGIFLYLNMTLLSPMSMSVALVLYDSLRFNIADGLFLTPVIVGMYFVTRSLAWDL